ncbi:hypothetical protein [Bacillus gaemokensis]|uniref:hypothetical protein n=1 Tax=Bacillus gaemokensis TaxID=574375 RepID=UPI00068D8E51|nr:hypothetical protein [Bacillus gaemokensis]KYG34547.1 hypothetical protein AZF08_09115 [Bacillus gaemokensis]
MASYVYNTSGSTSTVSGWTDANSYGSGATSVDFTQVNNVPGATVYYTIYLQRNANGTWNTTDTASGSFKNNVTRSFNITDNLPGLYRVKGVYGGSTNYTDAFNVYR